MAVALCMIKTINTIPADVLISIWSLHKLACYWSWRPNNDIAIKLWSAAQVAVNECRTKRSELGWLCVPLQCRPPHKFTLARECIASRARVACKCIASVTRIPIYGIATDDYVINSKYSYQLFKAREAHSLFESRASRSRVERVRVWTCGWTAL